MRVTVRVSMQADESSNVVVHEVLDVHGGDDVYLDGPVLGSVAGAARSARSTWPRSAAPPLCVVPRLAATLLPTSCGSPRRPRHARRTSRPLKA